MYRLSIFFIFALVGAVQAQTLPDTLISETAVTQHQGAITVTESQVSDLSHTVDTTLDEAAVDGFVANNGYLTSEADGDIENEIQNLFLVGNDLTLSGDLTVVDLTPYLPLTESAVDAFVGNNGYLTSEVDGSTSNEIQDLDLTGNTLSLSLDGTTVDLSGYLDDTTLSDAQVRQAALNEGFVQGAHTVDTNTNASTLCLGLESLRGNGSCVEPGTGSGGANELSDLTDVGSATATNRNVLVADGAVFQSRALVKADVSDFSDGDYATAAQGAKADSATQPGDNVSTLINDSGYITTQTDDQNAGEVPLDTTSFDNNLDAGDVDVQDLAEKFDDFSPGVMGHGDGTDCGAGSYARGVDGNGNAELCTPDSDTQLSDSEVETAYNNQVSVVSQAEAEAGTATTVRRWTAERVGQAITALAAGGGSSGASKFHQRYAGRWTLNASANWVGTNNNYAFGSQTWTQSAGGGSAPAFNWQDQGLGIYKENTALKKLSISYRTNNAEIEGFDIYLLAVGTGFDAEGYDDNADANYDSDVVLDVTTITHGAGNSNDMHGEFEIDLGDYTFDEDKLLLIAARPTTLLSTNRFLYVTLLVEYEL